MLWAQLQVFCVQRGHRNKTTMISGSGIDQVISEYWHKMTWHTVVFVVVRMDRNNSGPIDKINTKLSISTDRNPWLYICGLNAVYTYGATVSTLPLVCSSSSTQQQAADWLLRRQFTYRQKAEKAAAFPRTVWNNNVTSKHLDLEYNEDQVNETMHHISDRHMYG